MPVMPATRTTRAARVHTIAGTNIADGYGVAYTRHNARQRCAGWHSNGIAYAYEVARAYRFVHHFFLLRDGFARGFFNQHGIKQTPIRFTLW